MKKAPRVSDLIERLLKISLKKAGSKLHLSQILGARPATVYQWYQGVQPSKEYIEKLEDYIYKG